MVVVSREWAMPSKWTFECPPIAAFLKRWVRDGKGWADPFAGENSPAEFTNDIEGRGAKSQKDGLLFLQGLRERSLSGVIFDPPYSPRQCLRLYVPSDPHGGTAGVAEYQARCRDEIARVVAPGGRVLCFGWDSNGMGTSRGFTLQEVLLVCHGALHRDTICTADRRMNGALA